MFDLYVNNIIKDDVTSPSRLFTKFLKINRIFLLISCFIKETPITVVFVTGVSFIFFDKQKFLLLLLYGKVFLSVVQQNL